MSSPDGEPAGWSAGTANEQDFYPIPVELLAGLDRLQGAVTFGQRNAEIRLYEFFDYNCGWCRRTAADARALVQANRDIAVTLVNYAVLGIPSISASRVPLAFSRQKADRYLDFHEALFKRRGTIDGQIALDVAGTFGVDRTRLLADADSDAVTAALRASAQLGNTFGFQATPSYLMGREALPASSTGPPNSVPLPPGGNASGRAAADQRRGSVGLPHGAAGPVQSPSE